MSVNLRAPLVKLGDALLSTRVEESRETRVEESLSSLSTALDSSPPQGLTFRRMQCRLCSFCSHAHTCKAQHPEFCLTSRISNLIWRIEDTSFALVPLDNSIVLLLPPPNIFCTQVLSLENLDTSGCPTCVRVRIRADTHREIE